MSKLNAFSRLTESAVRRIEQEIEDLVERARLRCVMVVDHSGYIIARRGEIEHARAEELAAVAAGSFASFVLMFQTSEMTASFHTKGVDNIHFVHVNPSILLLALYNENSDFEKVRQLAHQTAAKARDAIGEDTGLKPKLGSVQYINAKLDEMFEDL